MPSGCMSNLAAIMNCSNKGDEIIVGSESHIYRLEQGSCSSLGNVLCLSLQNQKDGTIKLKDIENHLHECNILLGRISMLCLENSHNLCGGKALSLE